MNPKHNDKIEELRKDFQELVDFVMEDGSPSCTAHEVELTIFRKLLQLGGKLLKLFFSEKRRHLQKDQF